MARLVFVVIAEDRDVTDEDATLSLLEGGVLQLLPDEIRFLSPQLGEVVEACIFLMVVGLILTAVQYHEAGIAPTDAAVGLVVGITYQPVHASRIIIAYFVVASDKEDRCFCSIDGVGQAMNHTHGVFAIVRFRQAVTIEDNKVGLYTNRFQCIA